MSDFGTSGTKPDSVADEVVDELMPAQLDWQDMVRRYPLAALALATLGGYVLGRHRGREILEAFSLFAADSVSEQVNSLLGKDVL
jgi:predicted metal-dependent peptidase